MSYVKFWYRILTYVKFVCVCGCVFQPIETTWLQIWEHKLNNLIKY